LLHDQVFYAREIFTLVQMSFTLKPRSTILGMLQPLSTRHIYYSISESTYAFNLTTYDELLQIICIDE